MARKYLRFGVISAGLLVVFPTVVAIVIVFFMPMDNKQQEDTVEFYAFWSWGILTLILLVSTLGFLLASLVAQARYRRAHRN